MKPYYSDAYVTLWHGDSRELLASVGRFGVVVADPWYGINATRTRNSQKWGWIDYGFSESDDTARTDPALLLQAIALGDRAIVWGGNYFTDVLPPSSRWLVWDKGQTDFSLADVELAWCSWAGAARRKLHTRGRLNQEGRVHPNQKPLDLMLWCLGFAEGSVLDPFSGSGTTLVAAKMLRRKVVGIELEERYCEIAAQRCSQETLELGA